MPSASNPIRVVIIVDGETEEVVDAVRLTTFILEDFKMQFDVDPVGDPNMLDRYGVGPDDIEFLAKRLERPIAFNLERYAYFIEAAI